MGANTFEYQFVEIGAIEITSIITDTEYEIETIWHVNVESGSEVGNILISRTKLYNCYPNPFNPSTTISFELNTENTEDTELVIYNIEGQKVKLLVSDQLSAGQHSVIWYGKDENNKPVTSGIYFYKLNTDKFEQTRKMILMK